MYRSIRRIFISAICVYTVYVLYWVLRTHWMTTLVPLNVLTPKPDRGGVSLLSKLQTNYTLCKQPCNVTGVACDACVTYNPPSVDTPNQSPDQRNVSLLSKSRANYTICKQPCNVTDAVCDACVTPAPLPDKHSLAMWRKSQANYTLGKHSCSVTDVVCDTCCYCYTPALHILKDFGELGPIELKKRKCEKRLPKAIIIGTMKSGTYALRTYLSYHPDLAMAYDEPTFWNYANQGLERYRRQMHYSTPGQVTIEKTPDYYHSEGAPKRIKKDMPHDVKIIMIMKDPVKRAISHYNFHVLHPNFRTKLPATFKETVLTANGKLKENSPYISMSVYDKYVRKWLQYFPPERFLGLDGDPFIRNPVPQLQQIERYLGVRPFFTQDMFTKDDAGFWCMVKPIATCVPQSQPHPPHSRVSDDLLVKLYRFFRPHNQNLAKLLNDTSFEWLSN